MVSGHVDTTKPPRPLSAHALSLLRLAAESGGVHKSRLNPGVRDKFSREGLAEVGPKFGFYYATVKGRLLLVDIDAASAVDRDFGRLGVIKIGSRLAKG